MGSGESSADSATSLSAPVRAVSLLGLAWAGSYGPQNGHLHRRPVAFGFWVGPGG